ncbi:MAG: DUF1926 domain-containing protein [Planctomycetes bacterium]|nr:DUF1926 domain-containing protein [Planctomycetota bacterium]
MTSAGGRPSVHLVLALHCHQPLGNFEQVFEEAYARSYLPMLEVLERHPALPVSLHYSGCLLEWIEARHPDYLDRLSRGVAAGRFEMLGGGHYEPVLTMLPERDREGQLRRLSEWLGRRLGERPTGMWLTERVWEQCLASSVARAGLRYTLVDESHFRLAGLSPERLVGPFLTEDQGELLRVLPIDERLRYLIPFHEPEEVVAHLEALARRQPGALAVYGDDGEKFGVWPRTYERVYAQGWLERFLALLEREGSWLRVLLAGEAVRRLPPAGKVYLPDSSYHEMNEWTLPLEEQGERQRMAREPWFAQVRGRLRGGSWRSFRTRYPEAELLYGRTLYVGERLREARGRLGAGDALLEEAEREHYRSQCNCPYWHGVFGGLYLPHLRGAVQAHAIRADLLLDRALGTTYPALEVLDLDRDGHEEVLISNAEIKLGLKPHQGGSLYALDCRPGGSNLVDTLARRREAYHDRVASATVLGRADGGGARTIHDAEPAKEADLASHLFYDALPRWCLLDRVSADSPSAERSRRGELDDPGGFSSGNYALRATQDEGAVRLALTRQARVEGTELRLEKTLELPAEGGRVAIGYALWNLGPDAWAFILATEFNLAMQAGDAPDRYYRDPRGAGLGRMSLVADLVGLGGLDLVDEWRRLEVRLRFSRSAGIALHPVETVSRSEAGFERVYQGSAVIPHWRVALAPGQEWQLSMTLEVATPGQEPRSTSGTGTAAHPGV